jgi:ATP-dependent Clp protease ATP-binding subunit ClpA
MSNIVSHLGPECMQAVELARLALPEGQRLDVPAMLDALFNATALKDDPSTAGLARLFPPPVRLHETPPPAPVDAELKRILLSLRDSAPVSPGVLFSALTHSESGRRLLAARGATVAELLQLTGLEPSAVTTATAEVLGGEQAPRPPVFPKIDFRSRALEELTHYGTILTRPPGPTLASAKVVSDALMRGLMQYLYTPRSRNILLVAPPGTGKTSLIHTLAHKVIHRDPVLPAALADIVLFELSPMFPRQGEIADNAYLPPEDFKHARRLLRVLQELPGVILVIDRLVTFLNLLFRLSAHQELVDEFRSALDAGTLTCMAGVHPDDLDRIAEVDRSLLRRFRTLHLPAPAAEDVVKILTGRIARLEEHFQPLKIPPEILPRLVSLTDTHLRDRNQPEKSIRLLEAACARAALEEPPAPALTETHVLQALEGFIGPVMLPGKGISVPDLMTRLGEQIVGQDEGLHELAEAVVAGRADNGWFMRPGPRGVFLFGGPTGVGKTETALVLARVLGGGSDALVRVDCQNLQGSGEGWEANTLTWRLLGVAPGYRGHVPGCRDGLLVKVRDYPECVLLFDEFEKADSAVGRLILRILDEGKCQDSEGTEIDFRRCVVILTSNVGVRYDDPEKGNVGFVRSAQRPTAVVTEETVAQGLLGSGLGQEFMGRIQHIVLFQALTDAHIREIIDRQLKKLGDLALARGKKLSWTEAAIERLAARWKTHPHLGARYLTTLVRVQILDPLNVAAAGGELGDDIAQIVLDGAAPDDGKAPRPRSERRREGDVLRIVLR